MIIGDTILFITVFFGLFTSIFFLLTLLEKFPQPKKKLSINPKVCIVVPCYNEESTVAKTIESLLKLDYNNLEIIVVDDGSKDNTYKIAKKFSKQGVRVLRKKNGGKFTALNLALKTTKAQIVGALDADSFVDSNALKRMLVYFEDPKVMAVTPSMKVYKPKKWLQKVQWTEYLLGIFLRKVFAFLGSQHVTPGPFSLYRKAFFEKHGYYKNAHHTEDIEIALRIQSHNYEIANAHDAYVYTVGPDNFKGLWNQRIRWYYGFLRNLEDYKQLFSKRHGVLGLFILPASFFSIFLVIVGMAYALFRLMQSGWDKLLYLRATGFDISQLMQMPRFDTFFLNLSSTAILGLIAFTAGVIIILIAKRLAGETDSIIERYVWFLLFYWLLFGLWWMAAFYTRISGKKMTWRHKSEL